jgi:hypothetical protein
LARPAHNRNRLLGRLLAGAVAVASVACAPQVEESVSSTVRVRPQVVVDGLVELTARTEGELFVDEVLLHAPEVSALEHGESTNLLRTDPIEPGALFFRYDIDDPEGSAVRSERRWALRGCDDEAEVVFGFAPLDANASQLDLLENKTATDLGSLNGYTALIHGYVAVPADEGTTLKSVLNADSEVPHDGDPDGMPAQPDGLEQSGDPDGMPADEAAAGDPDGMPADGDPDGMPADGDPDGMPADEAAAGDPDGMPAAGDPDGMPADGDPDGMPARLKELGERTGSLARDRTVLKPFVLVIPAAMELSLPVSDLDVDTTDEDSFLPIDLHIDIGALLSRTMIDRLEQITADDDEEASVVVRDISGVFDLVTRRVTSSDDDADEPESKLTNLSDSRRR